MKYGHINPVSETALPCKQLAGAATGSCNLAPSAPHGTTCHSSGHALLTLMPAGNKGHRDEKLSGLVISQKDDWMLINDVV